MLKYTVVYDIHMFVKEYNVFQRAPVPLQFLNYIQCSVKLHASMIPSFCLQPRTVLSGDEVLLRAVSTYVFL